MQQNILFGIDIFIEKYTHFKNKNIALVTNDAATTTNGISSRAALLDNGFTLKKLFSPEHGLYKIGEDGVAQNNTTDAITKLPVVSLYGTYLQPTINDLEDIDIVLFDIPDIGCRFYTYLWTMTHIMEACALNSKLCIILDRPNPTGIDLMMAEGPFLNEMHCASFIGRWNIPIKHCCTLGELANYFAATKIKNLEYEIVKISHYNRDDSKNNAFVFTPTSPAMQHLNSVYLYPGLGLLEGVNLNEGRGTPMPFTIFGAPFIQSKDVIELLKLKNNSAISFAAENYIPTSGLYKGEECKGVKIKIIDKDSLYPVHLGFSILETVILMYKSQLQERLYCTAVNPIGINHLDKLTGIYHSFEKLQNGFAFNINVQLTWKSRIEKYLLY